MVSMCVFSENDMAWYCNRVSRRKVLKGHTGNKQNEVNWLEWQSRTETSAILTRVSICSAFDDWKPWSLFDAHLNLFIAFYTGMLEAALEMQVIQISLHLGGYFEQVWVFLCMWVWYCDIVSWHNVKGTYRQSVTNTELTDQKMNRTKCSSVSIMLWI
jgi:hypothetical protein